MGLLRLVLEGYQFGYTIPENKQNQKDIAFFITTQAYNILLP